MDATNIRKEALAANGIKLVMERDAQEIGRAYLYLLKNDLHDKPFGLVEDLFVDEGHRGGGIGTALMKELIEEAKRSGCYKIIFTSRYSNKRAHRLYLRLGFKDFGKEFRMDID